MKKHLSYTQISMYMRCGLQYYYRYIRGLTIQPPASMIWGKSFHKSVESAYKEMLNGGKPSINALQDIFETEFKGCQNKMFDEGETEDGLLILGAKSIPVFHDEVIQRTEPVSVEKKFSLEFSNTDYSLDGYIDLITIGNEVIDNKTSGKSYSQGQTDTDLQLSIYSMVEQKEHVGHDVLVKTKEPKAQRLRSVVSDRQRERSLAIMARVAQGIEAGLFMPCDPTSWICNEKWCGYYKICHEEF